MQQQNKKGHIVGDGGCKPHAQHACMKDQRRQKISRNIRCGKNDRRDEGRINDSKFLNPVCSQKCSDHHTIDQWTNGHSKLRQEQYDQ